MRPRRQEARERVEAERQQRDDAFWKSAKRVRAKVLSAWHEGNFDLMPEMRLTLEIQNPDGNYQLEVTQPIRVTDVHRVSEGSVLTVWIDPSKRDRIEICHDAE